jgi:hypothetical protein
VATDLPTPENGASDWSWTGSLSEDLGCNLRFSTEAVLFNSVSPHDDKSVLTLDNPFGRPHDTVMQTTVTLGHRLGQRLRKAMRPGHKRLKEILVPSFLAVVFLGAMLPAKTGAIEFYVGTNGNDAWTGRLSVPNAQRTDGPFATLERARDEIRKLKKISGLPNGGIAVAVHGGRYSLNQPFELAAEDSGTAQTPIAYRAWTGEEVRLSGGKVITGFKPVSDPALLNRLDESARGQVLEADLRAFGITNYGTPAGGGLELFFQDQPMALARWPNHGFVRIVEVLGKTPIDDRGTKGCVEGIFTYDGDRPKRWVEEKAAWLHGYWFYDWSDKRQKIKTIDPAKRIIELEPPGSGYRKGQWYYAYNLLSEIDQPGEWYLDREKGILYFWPPAPIQSGQATVSILPTLVVMKDVAHVTLRGFILEAARGTAVTVAGGEGDEIVGCTIRNVGSSAVSISGGAHHAVVGCDICQCGAGGVSLEGGNRQTLEPAGHCADNNHIHHYGRWQPTYSAGIALNGVGNRATHNLIDNAPHQAIGFGGNDHLMEFNEIHSVCFESNDAGAIYAGRDWTMRGTIIRHNYLHDISGFEARGCVGVYLDDMLCGTAIIGNVFYRVTSAAFIGGGRDCTIENNIFVDCRPAVHVDGRALGWAKPCADGWVQEGRQKETLCGTRYQKPPYSERYPKLVNILADDPGAPKGNLVARNICVGGQWEDIDRRARPFTAFQDNLLKEDPRFVDAAQLDFRLQADSPAFRLGFKPIPIERIGLYKDDRRASWPVRHDVRPP